MNSTYKTIVLATDGSKTARAAETTALDFAKKNSARVLIVDAVRRPSRISSWFSGNADDLFDMAVNEKQKQLDQVANSFEEVGVETKTRILIGNSSEEIARTAIAENADLVIRYMKGQASRMPGPFGTTARNLMRVCPAPLLLISEGRPVSNPKVLACVNAEHKDSENTAIINESKKLVGESSSWELLYCWDFSGNEFMAGYVSDELMKRYLSDSERNFRKVFQGMLKNNSLSPDDRNVYMEQGIPADLIPVFCEQESIDVVVMSSASQNHPLHRLLGSTVESVLDSLPCSLLVVKPIGFKSPIKPSESMVDVSA